MRIHEQAKSVIPVGTSNKNSIFCGLLDWRACNTKISDMSDPFGALPTHNLASPWGDGMVFALSRWNFSAIAMFARAMFCLFLIFWVSKRLLRVYEEAKSVVSLGTSNKNYIFVV